MKDNKKTAIEEIENKASLICEVADRIWEYAELSLMEYKSCNLYCDKLTQEGFDVEKGICNIPTAFKASFGKGKPVIGILAEYDALSGLSQERGVAEKKEFVPKSGEASDAACDRSAESCGGASEKGNTGHGCGHNLLGAGALAAAIGIKKYLSESGSEGTVILYGCPGEEGCASKAFMARDGEWKKLDAALTWHPADCNEVVTGSSNSCIQVMYTFHGKASHASGAPEMGRSALDAVELMNVGVQFLREHMSEKARVHYAITDGGGVSPNVVQPSAQVLYMVRSNHVSEAVELQKRVDKIAEGAALMTETTYDREFIDGLSDTVTNRSLEKVLYSNFEELGVPEHTSEELDFAGRLGRSYEGFGDVPGIGSDFDEEYADSVKALRKTLGEELKLEGVGVYDATSTGTQEGAACPMNDFLLPHYMGYAFEPGSTDVGDVSWVCPTAQIHVAAWPNGCPGHSWQNVSSAGSSIGHKAAIHAGKVLCMAAIDLYENSDLLQEARAEFEKRTASGYVCPIPEGAVAKALDI